MGAKLEPKSIPKRFKIQIDVQERTDMLQDRLGTVLEPFWRVLGPLLVDFPTRGERPGRLPEVIFEAFFGRPGREATKRQFCTYVDVFSYVFYAMCSPLLPSLLRGRRRRTNAKMMKIHWFLWVVSHMRLFSGSARSNQISEGTRSKKRLKISSKMRTQGTNIDVPKKRFLRPKWLPRWTPEAS